MNRFQIVLVVALFAAIVIRPVAAQIPSDSSSDSTTNSDPKSEDSAGQSKETKDSAKEEELILGAMLQPGAAGDKVREIQATLNKKLTDVADSS